MKSTAVEDATPVMRAPLATECLVCSGALRQVCSGLFDTRFGIPQDYGVAVCSLCGLEQISPRPTASELRSLYEQYYNFDGETDTLYVRLREAFHNSFLYRWWIAVDGDISFHSRKGSGRLLDVGCNEGRGLSIYRRNGFEVEGLELNRRAAEVARKRGFRVYTELLEDFVPERPYDVVILSNVLEHSLEPQRMLADVARLLAPSAQVWISCPNSRSGLRKMFGDQWINWHVPFHISHFSGSSLQRLLRESGFDRVQVHYETPALWVASTVLARLFAKRGKRNRSLRSPAAVAGLTVFSRCVLFPVWFILNRIGYGDCLVAVAHGK